MPTSENPSLREDEIPLLSFCIQATGQCLSYVIRKYGGSVYFMDYDGNYFDLRTDPLRSYNDAPPKE